MPYDPIYENLISYIAFWAPPPSMEASLRRTDTVYDFDSIQIFDLDIPIPVRICETSEQQVTRPKYLLEISLDAEARQDSSIIDLDVRDLHVGRWRPMKEGRTR